MENESNNPASGILPIILTWVLPDLPDICGSSRYSITIRFTECQGIGLLPPFLARSSWVKDVPVERHSWVPVWDIPKPKERWKIYGAPRGMFMRCVV